jgi:putative tricarboxylic transport membrane protein
MHLPDRVTGLFMVALGGLAAYGGSRLPPVPGQQIGPNVFPLGSTARASPASRTRN